MYTLLFIIVFICLALIRILFSIIGSAFDAAKTVEQIKQARSEKSNYLGNNQYYLPVETQSSNYLPTVMYNSPILNNLLHKCHNLVESYYPSPYQKGLEEMVLTTETMFMVYVLMRSNIIDRNKAALDNFDAAEKVIIAELLNFWNVYFPLEYIDLHKAIDLRLLQLAYHNSFYGIRLLFNYTRNYNILCSQLETNFDADIALYKQRGFPLITTENSDVKDTILKSKKDSLFYKTIFAFELINLSRELAKEVFPAHFPAEAFIQYFSKNEKVLLTCEWQFMILLSVTAIIQRLGTRNTYKNMLEVYTQNVLLKICEKVNQCSPHTEADISEAYAFRKAIYKQIRGKKIAVDREYLTQERRTITTLCAYTNWLLDLDIELDNTLVTSALFKKNCTINEIFIMTPQRFNKDRKELEEFSRKVYDLALKITNEIKGVQDLYAIEI